METWITWDWLCFRQLILFENWIISQTKLPNKPQKGGYRIHTLQQEETLLKLNKQDRDKRFIMNRYLDFFYI